MKTNAVKIALSAALALAVLVPGGTYVYIHYISDGAPSAFTLDASGAASSATTGSTRADTIVSADVSGTWKPASKSQLGYRVNEVLFGQRKEAVGRTSRVTGEMVIVGATVTAVDLTADMTSVTSDQARRDAQFQGRIMNTTAYPTATFKLTKPIELASIPPGSEPVTTGATGVLTLHGTTKPVTFDIAAKRQGSSIAVSGAIPITFAEWGIPNPSFGPVTTDDHGVLEFLVVFAKA